MFGEDILIINVALPVLLEFAELAASPIYPPSSISRKCEILLHSPSDIGIEVK
jgi:hypothetical protein